MNYRVKHGLSDLSSVHTVVEKAFASYEDRLSDYKPAIRWASDHQAVIGFMVMSQTITANVEFDQEELRIDGKVPFLFKPFQKKIESVLAREMDKWLDKARKGEI